MSRWLIGVGGGVLAVEGLRRRSLTGALLAGIGGSLAWWAITGNNDFGGARRWWTAALERTGRTRADLIQETSAESFPASDAPSWTPTVGTGLRNRLVDRQSPATPPL